MQEKALPSVLRYLGHSTDSSLILSKEAGEVEKHCFTEGHVEDNKSKAQPDDFDTMCTF